MRVWGLLNVIQQPITAFVGGALAAKEVASIYINRG